jgi:predicted porin
MKKLLIAAIMASVTGMSVAQVAVNGEIRYDIIDAKGTDATTGISRSQITIRVTEDIGNGIKLRAGVGLDGGGRGETVEGTDSFIAVNSPMGEVMVGQIEVSNSLLPLTQNLTPVMGTDGRVLGATTNKDVISYTSPMFAGFRASVQAERDIVAAGSSADQTYVFGLDGKIGPVTTRVDYTKDIERIRASGTAVLANVTFGAGISAGEKVVATGAKVKDSWILAAAVPVGPVTVGATYAEGNGKSTEIAARYHLSKRTNITLAHRDVTENSSASRNIPTTRIRIQHRF